MEIFKIKLIIYLCLTAFFAILISSCGDDTTQPPVSNNNDSCGSQNIRVRTWTGPLYSVSTYTLASERYYNFFYEVDSICTDNHVNSAFIALAKDVPGRPIRFSAAIEWQVFWERTDTGRTTISSNTRSWEAEIRDLGLRVPFGDNPAKVFINIYVHFLTLGSAQQDSVFLSENLVSCGMDLSYKYHKFTADDNLITSANYHEMKLFHENDEKYLFEKKMKSALNQDLKQEKILQADLHR